MTCKHSVLSLIKFVYTDLHFLGRGVNRYFVVVCKQVYEVLSFLLLDIIFPNAKNVYSPALVVWTSKSIFVVSVSLAVVKTHQAPFFEDVILADGVDH